MFPSRCLGQRSFSPSLPHNFDVPMDGFLIQVMPNSLRVLLGVSLSSLQHGTGAESSQYDDMTNNLCMRSKYDEIMELAPYQTFDARLVTLHGRSNLGHICK